MKKHIQVLRVMSVLVWAAAACVTLSARAALTVTATNGVESLTLAFDAAADARELWVAWDDADKGAGFADWAESERVAIVAADETSLTVALGDATALDETKIYTVATASGFTGTFANTTLPNRKWRVSVADTKVKLVYANGTVLFFR